MVDMEDNFEIQVVQGLDGFSRMRKSLRIKIERAVACIPTSGAITGAKIDQGIARQFLLTKGPGDFERFFGPGKSAMRLEVAESPFGRHGGSASQMNVFL